MKSSGSPFETLAFSPRSTNWFFQNLTVKSTCHLARNRWPNFESAWPPGPSKRFETSSNPKTSHSVKTTNRHTRGNVARLQIHIWYPLTFSNHDDAGRVLKAFEHVLVKLTAAIEDNSGTSTAADAERSLKNLLRWLQRDGFDFENGRLAAVGTRTSEVPAPVMPKQEAVTEPAMPACSSAGPTAFVSYSWDNEEHKQWVLDFATRLRHEGIDAKLDRWDVSLGDPLPQFMETAVRTNKFVLIVLTPNYAEKSDRRKSTYSAHHVVLRDQSATASRAGKTRKVLKRLKERPCHRNHIHMRAEANETKASWTGPSRSVRNRSLRKLCSHDKVRSATQR